LVNKNLWQLASPLNGVKIVQAYLLSDPEKVIRVRIKGEKAYLTIKGKTTGASRLEYEYEIPQADALQLISGFGSQIIEKTRYTLHYNSKLWEVDVFEGLNSGLIIAEIELESEDETYSIPEWAERNVTAFREYYNSYLAEHPFSSW
jgi:CYTH domain-containing protein